MQTAPGSYQKRRVDTCLRRPVGEVADGVFAFGGAAEHGVSPGTSGVPIAAYQFTLNTQSSAGEKMTFVTMQSGIGQSQTSRFMGGT
ncbi:hypothetical protein [Bradyrhizobium sp.]|uniref:hypothetical protein n=1 Tax=Bradyrhizobium sp. TaxID=376 RepID=UPI001D536B9E|nr:hypothetical protein [Bradyrhizobium sp.]MBI5319876.1 hypothetical protein [Bradyrhizobium sp.]